MAKIGSTQWHWHKTHRWFRPAEYAKRRCTDVKHREYPRYGGRGIEYLLTKEEVIKLFTRDDGDKLDRPSLDRIDPDGNYCFENCRFIEWSVNIATSHRNLKNFDRWVTAKSKAVWVDQEWV
jgi:hypothetical protein